jgi:hypothetical protein
MLSMFKKDNKKTRRRLRVYIVDTDADGNIIKALYPVTDSLFKRRYILVTACAPREGELAVFCRPVLGKCVWNMKGRAFL